MEMSVLLCSNILNRDICENIYKQLCVSKTIPEYLRIDIQTFSYLRYFKNLYFDKYGYNIHTLEIIWCDLAVLLFCLTQKYDGDYIKEINYFDKTYPKDIQEFNYFIHHLWLKHFDYIKRQDVIEIVKQSLKQGNILKIWFEDMNFYWTR
tara:strand:- start:33 stop:482 length:450 start_codon:yes stop_codon:yes gene_type:complete